MFEIRPFFTGIFGSFPLQMALWMYVWILTNNNSSKNNEFISFYGIVRRKTWHILKCFHVVGITLIPIIKVEKLLKVAFSRKGLCKYLLFRFFINFSYRNLTEPLFWNSRLFQIRKKPLLPVLIIGFLSLIPLQKSQIMDF